MKPYHDLLQDILDNGEVRDDRTNTGTISLFGKQLTFDLNEGFPAITTKKLAWKSVVSELLWFLEGTGDERRLCEILHKSRDSSLTTIWTGNATADYWTDKAQYEGDLGRVYGVQWRNWTLPKLVPTETLVHQDEQGKWQLLPHPPSIVVDQIAQLIDGLKNNPTSRRHIINAWNVAELDNMALPPCHVMSQFYVSTTGSLSCHMYQRSADVFLGTPFNIASYALLTHMLAQVCDLTVGKLVISMGDSHIYLNHVDQVKEQLSREHLPYPKLWLNEDIKDIDDFTMEDIKLVGYKSHSTITAKMAV